jgi:hypothetical protein
MSLRRTVRTRTLEICIEFKRSYQPKSNLVKDKNGDLHADSHNILNRWKTYISQLLNVHSVNIRQTEIHRAEPLVLDPIHFEFRI